MRSSFRRVGKGAKGRAHHLASARWWARTSGAHSRDPLALPTLRSITLSDACGDGRMTDIKKVALVTGAARGIGLSVAKKFLGEGWCVALLDIEGKLLRDAAAALDAADDTLALQCDVSD